MNLLETFAASAVRRCEAGYYEGPGGPRPAPSLVQAIRDASATRTALVAELKPATPTRGRFPPVDVKKRLAEYRSAGACGISVLTDPDHFGGSLATLDEAVATGLPVLMKDFIVKPDQVHCAARRGAAAVLLIEALHTRRRLNSLIRFAHELGREVLLEIDDERAFRWALASDADLVGINNRDLRTFDVDLRRTVRIAGSGPHPKPILSLSGIRSPEDVRLLRPHVDALLVGSALMEGRVEVSELVNA